MKSDLIQIYFLPLIAGLLIVVACGSEKRELPETAVASAPRSIAATAAPRWTSPATPTTEFTPSPAAVTPSQQAEPVVCSPLEGVGILDLPAMVVNPFAPPPPGRDEPHHGVDIAQRDAQTQISLEGLRVQAVLQGRVAAAIDERFPYGNALILETLISELPEDLQAELPSLAPTPAARSPLTCPQVAQDNAGELERESLYLLYAHLKEPPDLQVGALVSCGQTLGAIGSSGNALNPHLHLEARVGLAGVSFSSLGHYDSRLTPQEMANYCYWRISGWFRLVDPFLILGLNP